MIPAVQWPRLDARCVGTRLSIPTLQLRANGDLNGFHEIRRANSFFKLFSTSLAGLNSLNIFGFQCQNLLGGIMEGSQPSAVAIVTESAPYIEPQIRLARILAT